MSEFKREVRYTVIKHSQLTESQMAYLKGCIFGEGIPTVKAVVVEADWPEYGQTWKMIEDRVSGAPVEGGKAEYDASAQAMTTNQTIDGAPRELRALLERVVGKPTGKPNWDALDEDRIAATEELRALLDAPVDPASALNRAWQAGYDTGYYAKNPAHERTAAQPQGEGEPVAWMQPGQGGMCISSEVKLHSLKMGGAPASAVSGYSVPLYAEQLAPVAVVLPPKLKSPAFKTVDRGSVNYAAGWNAYANELKRLNPSL